MLILRAVVHQEQEAGRRQAVDQAIEQRLGLGVDPVQVLKDEQQGLHLAFAQQQALERGQGALPPLRRIERQKWAVFGQRLQEPSSAGMASWSDSSRVSTCPVTLARTVRGSSPSSTCNSA